MTCTPLCWIPVTCRSCGREKAPLGRAVPLEIGIGLCSEGSGCSGYREMPLAPHLWSEHDPTRVHSDPEGWADHMAECGECLERFDAPDLEEAA